MVYAKKCQPLQVKGTKIVTAKGKEITLRGVSTHGIAWFPQYVNKEAFRSFQKMGENKISLALYSDPAAGFQKTLYGKVEEGIKAATDLGMYVIVDWHILSDGNPKTNQSAAKAFFTHFAKKYASPGRPYGEIRRWQLCTQAYHLSASEKSIAIQYLPQPRTSTRSYPHTGKIKTISICYLINSKNTKAPAYIFLSDNQK